MLEILLNMWPYNDEKVISVMLIIMNEKKNNGIHDVI